jgi:catechol 2,3-dioxygenase-like lactoylglutathione lyase family enzyme
VEILGVDHVDLTVNDLDRSTAFYEKVLGALGFRRILNDHGVVFGNRFMTIGLYLAAPEERGIAFHRYRVGLHHLALKAMRRSDVDAYHAFLVREGVSILEGGPADYPQYAPAYYALFFADPDGMKIEFVHCPYGYWRRVQADGHDERSRFPLARDA